ncbi:hypothetical protein H2204_002854 [Knufia peltigerae]|uniref:Bacteriophage T5 Orf172 DNA-binding domain-containing protein n=1 Tax=Knufia peltigerae TaxID=1002370 RepID=A0AA38YA54_9EURO|nr:hypothetical protein H2204_002854 [Knufia peltigerae]
MSFSGRTPESLLPRSDSKNPATTCRGITSTGRPCRRALAASPKTSPAPSPTRSAGVLAVLEEQNAAAFYCWQHKDQAERLLASAKQHKTTLHPLKEKSSIDTLVERVGVLDLDESVLDQRKRHRRRHESTKHNVGGPMTTTRRETLPAGWTDMQSPIMKVPENMSYQKIHHRPTPPPPPRSNVKLSWACCIQTADDDDDYPPPRTHRPRERQPSRPHPSNSSHDYGYARPSTRPEQSAPVPARPSMTQRPDRPLHTTTQSSPSATLPRPPLTSSLPSHKTNSETRALLSLIPSTLSPQTTSLLLTELSRPISPADETGYIYIFWLTPASESSKPDDETASSLLDDGDAAEVYTRSTQAQAQALQRYASVRRPLHGRVQRTVMLKIGRAENVHRRLTQWTKQCGQNITLVRYYPYATTASPNGATKSRSSGPGGGEDPSKKVPHVHRVERLIHLELAEKRVANKAECEACGRVHQEWFEIEATRAGLKGVDEVIRRWVGWAQRQ